MYKTNSTIRINRRHLLVAGDREDIEKALLEYLGVLGFSKAAPLFTKKGAYWIVSVDRGELIHVRAALALYRKPLDILRVSGTIQGLKILRKT